MGNIADLFSELNINTKALTKKKQQTDYTICNVQSLQTRNSSENISWKPLIGIWIFRAKFEKL